MHRHTLPLFVFFAMLFPLSAAAATTCIDLSRTLTLSSRGEDVKQLQIFLRDSAEYNGAVTGFVGPFTFAAIKKWQTMQGVVSSGTPKTTGFGATGPKTRAAMACKSVSPAPVSASTTVITAPPVLPQLLAIATSSTATNTVPVAPSTVLASAPAGVGMPPNILSFYFDPNWLNAPGQSTLYWRADSASSCDIYSSQSSAAVATNQGVFASFAVTSTSTTAYTLACKGLGDGSTSTPKSASTTRSIIVAHIAPTCALSLDKTGYKIGDTARLSWSATDTDSAIWKHGVTDPYILPYGNVGSSGLYYLPINTQVPQTFQLNVSGQGGAASCTAPINITS